MNRFLLRPRRLVALLAFVPLVVAVPRAAQAAPDVCTVQANNPHSSIQQAVDSGCSQIRLTPGTYHENVVIHAGQTVSITSVAGANKAVRDRTIVDGGGAGSVFSIYAPANVTLQGLTIQNGDAIGGGIINGGTLTLNNSVVTGNQGLFGGGIFNAGTLTLNNSVVANNTAELEGGGIQNVGGTLTLNNSEVSNNTASGGGGIHNKFLDGTVTLNSSLITGNSAAWGGGLWTSVGSVTLLDSPITGNSADVGGGIALIGGTVTLINSPVTNNDAESFGGGIALTGGTFTLINSPVTGNTPDDTYGL